MASPKEMFQAMIDAKGKGKPALPPAPKKKSFKENAEALDTKALADEAKARATKSLK